MTDVAELRDVLEKLDLKERKASRRAQVALIVIVVLGLIAIGTSALIVQNLTQQAASLTADIDRLEKKRDELLEVNADLEEQAEEDEQQIKALETDRVRIVQKIEDAREGLTEIEEKVKQGNQRAAIDIINEKKHEIDVALPSVKPSKRDQARSLWSKGYRAFKSGDKNRAKQLYNKAIKTDARYAPPYNSLGRLADDPAVQEQYYRQALEKRNNYWAALYNMAVLHFNKREYGEARNWAKKALEARQGDEKTLTLLARIDKALPPGSKSAAKHP
ncbi:MAG: hypothetical protein QNJ97_16485 [Myxococcota bacterium]|nr:hypothetical protein [Myxococcota bacterium]